MIFHAVMVPIGKDMVNRKYLNVFEKKLPHGNSLNMSIHDDFLLLLDEAIDKYGNAARLAEALGVNANLITRWRAKDRIPNLNSIQPLIDVMGARLTRKTEATKDVCFVNAKIVPAGDNQPPPNVEDYMAVPLVEECGAGAGYIPQGELLSWFLVWKYQKSIQCRTDLIAVRVAKYSTSMVPTLRPEDIVLVDRQDKDIFKKGNIMLVMDPDGAGKIKRVAAERISVINDTRLVYYSDNATENPPEVYSLKNDFLNDIARAIVGKVVWAWSDMAGR